MLLWLCSTSLAQNPVYTSIDKAKGLPSNTVYDIYQDTKGFIWIAHDKGLSQYDGFRFIHYQNSQQRGRALSNLLEDSEGKIWCQSFVGQFFYTQGDSLHLCEALPATGMYSPAGILEGNTLASAGEASLRFLNTQTLTVEEKVVPDYTTNHYALTHRNTYYFFNKKTHQLFTLTKENTATPVPTPTHPNYFYLIPSRNATYYVPKYPNQEVNLIEAATGDTPFLFPDKTFIQNLRFVNDSTLAVLTTNGFYLFSDRFTPLTHQNKRFFENKNISTLIQDREGNWWVGTLTEGILFIPTLTIQKKLEDFSFSAIHASPQQGTLYLGTTHNQVWQYNTRTTAFTRLQKEDLNQEVTSLYFDSINHSLAYASDKVHIFQPGKPPLSFEGAIKEILPLDADHYVAAASGFVAIYNTQSTAKRTAWHTAFAKEGLYSNAEKTEFRLNKEEVRVRALALAKDTIYAATTNGLLAYTLRGMVPITFQGKSVMVTDLESYENQVYAATIDHGLLKVTGGVLQRCFTAEGLHSVNIYKLKINKGIAWMLTDGNLLARSLQSDSILRLDPTHELQADDLRDLAILNDTVYLVGNKGMVYFATTTTNRDSYNPTLILNSFLANQVRKNSTNGLKLKSTENDISIHYSVIAYRAGGRISVEYRINKADWKPLESTTRELHLASLAPDHYTVELRASSTDKSTPAAFLLLRFTILKPFYAQAWFLLICLAVLLIALYALYQFRLNKIEQRNKVEMDKLQLEQALQQSLLASIKAQMNPHFIYNSLSSIQSFVYRDDKENAIKYLDNFSELTRKVLELSNHESILLQEEIKLLETYISLEKMRFGDTLHYSIVCDEEIDLDFVRLPSMIIQPFVENAIKHGLLHRKDNKQLHITFAKAGEDLVITIDDNGIGRKTSAELKKHKNRNHVSFSISANTKRLELLNAKKRNTIGLRMVDKTDGMGRGSGTTVIITLPMAVSSI